MKTVWNFIEIDWKRKTLRTENYGSFSALWDAEQAGLKHLADSESKLRKVVKYKYESNLFHIEKKTVKRKENVNPRKKQIKNIK